VRESRHTRFSVQEKIIISLVAGASLLVWGMVIGRLVLASRQPRGRQDVQRLLTTLTPAVIDTPSPAPSLTPTHPSATNTPMPLEPTATWTPVPIATEAIVPSSIVGPKTTVVALLGIDEAKRAAIWRTDSIVLVLINEGNQRVGMVSIPRDLWVAIPGYGQERINTVDALGERTDYPGGGPGLLDQTLRYNLGIPVDHYARIDFRGFESLIDQVGGITIDVEAPIDDQLPDPLRPNAWKRFTLPAGLQHMDGDTALSYCRVRMATSDFDRSRRQRQVLVALWSKMFTLNALMRAPKLWDELTGIVDTDLKMLEAVRLAYVVNGIGIENIQSQAVGTGMTRGWVTPGGAQVLLPNTDAIQDAIHELMSRPR
jgi:LCP family protein required for cell wall assembly